ncbi:MAG: tetratricopeptide repeat protein [Acidobacteriota bacterium]
MRRPTARAVKFIRRHQLAVGLSTAGVLLLSSLSIFLAWQSAAITRERNAAVEARDQAQIAQRAEEQVVSFLTELFDNADPTRNNGEDISARDVVAAGAEKVHDLVESDPALGGRLSLVLAQVHDELGLYDETSLLFEQAALALQELPKPDHRLVSRALRGQAGAFVRLGKMDQAEALLERAIDEARLSGSQHDLAASFGSRGFLAQYRQNFEVCIEFYRQAILLQEKLTTVEGRENHIKSLLSLGACLDLSGQDEPAEQALLKAIALVEAGPQEFQYLGAFAQNNLGGFYSDRGEAAAAYEALESSAKTFEKVYGPHHENTATVLMILASMDGEQGRYLEAIANSEKALRSLVKTAGQRNSNAINPHCNLGVYYPTIGDNDKSEKITLECFEAAKEVLGPHARKTVDAQLILSELRIARGQTQGLSAALRKLKKAEDPGTPWTEEQKFWYRRLECGLRLQDRAVDEASASCATFLELTSAVSDAGSARVFRSQLYLLELRLLQTDLSGARSLENELVVSAKSLGDSLLPESHCRFARLRGDLAAALEEPVEAETHYRHALSTGRAAGLLNTHADMSRALDGLNRLALQDSAGPASN